MGGVYRILLDAIDPRVRLTQGRPAEARDIAALEQRLGFELPVDYAEFLREVGALRLESELPGRLGDLRFLGHAPDAADLAVDAALDALATEFERWRHDAVPAAPVLAYGGSAHDLGSECYAIAAGGLHSFRRGELTATDQMFADLFANTVEAVCTELAAGDAAGGAEHDFLDRLRARLPAAVLDPSPAETGRIVVVRPADGARIAIRFGDGREYRDDLHGVFVEWTESRTRTLDELDAWNRRARFVRAARRADHTRFRGRLLADGIDLDQFIAALAHDAELALGAIAPGRASVAELHAALAGVAEDHTGAESFGAIDGDRVVGSSAALVSMFSAGIGDTEVELAFAIDPAGLVRVSVAGALARPRDEALEIANRLHDNQLGDNNLDLEPFVKATLDGDRGELSVTTTLAALPTRAFDAELADLLRAVAKSRLLAGVDATERWLAGVERSIGIPVGPITARVLAATKERVVPNLSTWWKLGTDPARRADSPWGTLVVWGGFYESATALADRFVPGRVIDLAFAIDRRRSTDDCPVIGIVDGAGAYLADDLAALVSVIVLGTTGFDFDGDDDRVWRTFRAVLDRDGWIWSSLRELLADLDVEPATDVAAVQRGGDGPRRGAVEVRDRG